MVPKGQEVWSPVTREDYGAAAASFTGSLGWLPQTLPDRCQLPLLSPDLKAESIGASTSEVQRNKLRPLAKIWVF